MSKYSVEVIENLSRVVQVRADSLEEAEEMVNDMYKNGKIVLDSNDFQEVSIKSI